MIDLNHKDVKIVNPYSQSYDAWKLEWCTCTVTSARVVKDEMLSGML